MTAISTPRPEARPGTPARPVRPAPASAAGAHPVAARPLVGPRPTAAAVPARPLPPAHPVRTLLLVLLLLTALAAVVLLALPGDPVVIGRAGPGVLGALAVLVALVAATVLVVAGARRASCRWREPARTVLGLGVAVVLTTPWAAALGAGLLAASVAGVDRWTTVGEVDGRSVVVRESTSVTGLRVAVGVRDGWRVRVGSTSGGALSSPGEPTGHPSAAGGYALEPGDGAGSPAVVSFELDGPRRLEVPRG